jgi:serine/threonine protein kinase
VSGGTLHEWLAAARRPWRDVIARFVTAGRGLAAAHAAGLVHRDFKPSNVLVDGDGSVMVADFGIAAHVAGMTEDSGASSKMSSIAGTPAYMAPEQARGDEIDARADQYSFCVSLWEGLFGERPHQAATQTAVGRITRSIFVPKVHRELPAWVSDALLRGLSISPSQRWPSMTALIEHLEQRLAEPVAVEPKATRSPPVWIIAALVLAGVTAAAVAIAAQQRPAPKPEVRSTAPEPLPPAPPSPRDATVVVGDVPNTSARDPVESKARRAKRPNPDAKGDELTTPIEDLSRSRF